MLGLDIFAAQSNPLFERVYHVSTRAKEIVLGSSRIGDSTSEITEVTRQMNRIYAHHEVQPGGPDKLVPNTVTNTIAKELVDEGMHAIDRAAHIMPHGMFLPDQTNTINNRRNALLQHQQDIAGGNPAAPYFNKDKLRQDVTAAFIELSGATQAAADVDRISYWSEVHKRLSDIADEVWQAEQAIANALGKAIKQVEGGVKTVWWTVAALVAGGLLLVGVVTWKLISSGTVKHVGAAAVRGYLPR